MPGDQDRAGARAGAVWLVGAGPGDPDLLTRRAARVLAKADVVLIDHLIPRAILGELRADALVIDVGKRPDSHAMRQEEINALLVGHASRGLMVARLKGGDPFVFGRGGEEALACREAGIAVHVVPGVSSAVAVPAAAGIPVTHRGLAGSVLVLSGHAGWEGIRDQVGGPDMRRTLVFLMAARALESIMSGLASAGFPASTPVAVLERGWTSGSRTTVGCIGDIVGRCDGFPVDSPALVVVGRVVRLREALGDLAAPSAAAGHVPPDWRPGD